MLGHTAHMSTKYIKKHKPLMLGHTTQKYSKQTYEPKSTQKYQRYTDPPYLTKTDKTDQGQGNIVCISHISVNSIKQRVIKYCVCYTFCTNSIYLRLFLLSHIIPNIAVTARKVAAPSIEKAILFSIMVLVIIV